MSVLQKSRVKASSRRQINIKGVKDDILLLPNHQYRAVLEVSSLNFELKSEEEQDVLIDTFESFLNSLPCPLQIIVRIRELDMSRYLADLNDQLTDEKEPIYRSQIEDYTEFVRGLVANNKILSRHFYVVLPYASKHGEDFESAKEQLNINRDIVGKGLMRLGMQTRRLDSLEMLDLFQTFYNPEQAKRQPITDHVVRLLNTSYTRGARA